MPVPLSPLKRLLLVLLMVALPIQGQVAASMSCHQLAVQTEDRGGSLAFGSEPVKSVPDQSVVHRHANGQSHVHTSTSGGEPSLSSPSLSSPLLASVAADETRPQSQGCLVCAASCCQLAAIFVSDYLFQPPAAQGAVLTEPLALIAIAPPEDLLRPPRQSLA